MECRGAKGCAVTGNVVDCDMSQAEEKDFCDQDGNFSCTSDRKAQLKCEKNAWKVDTRCSGPKGCTTSPKLVECDDSIASVGDPCSKPDHHTCAADKSAVLVCAGGKFVVSTTCPKATCKVEASTVGCD